MKRNLDNKLTDIKKAEQDRRTELAMLGLLIEKYPNEAAEKIRRKSRRQSVEESEKPLVLRE